MIGVGNTDKYFEIETLAEEEINEEVIMTGLRTSKGIDLEYYEETFGSEAKNRLLYNAAKVIKSGLLECNEGCLRLTDSGVMVSDEIIVELF